MMYYAEITDAEREVATTRFRNAFNLFVRYGEFFNFEMPNVFYSAPVVGLKLVNAEGIEFGTYWIPDGSGKHGKFNTIFFIGDDEFTILSTDVFAPPPNFTTETVDLDKVFFELVDFVSDYFPEFSDAASA